MSDLEHPDDDFLDQEDEEWFIQELYGPFLAERPRAFTELEAWKDAMDFALRIYRLTGTFPEDEQQGLSLDIRQRTVSVPSTIASGCGRGTRQDLSQALETAHSLLAELHTLIEVSSQLGYISEFETELSVEHAMRVKREVTALQQSLIDGPY